MSEVGFVLLSGLLLSVPVGAKYWLAFQARQMFRQMKRQEREVERLTAQLEAIEQETVVLSRALRQVERQRNQARIRRDLVEERLEQVRRAASEKERVAA